MDGKTVCSFALLLIIVGRHVFCHQVVPSCDIEAEFCDFDFRIEENYTMMAWSGFLDDVPEIMYPIVVTANGTLKRKRKDCSGVDPISESDKKDIITGDGRYKKIYVVNDKLPGEPIIVYEGQEVSVKVTNRLEAGVTTMHWHGLQQRGSPWMDGVFGVSQCPIQPGQSFTYRFMADRAGTYWYHSHLGTQRSMGLAGPLIILPKSKDAESLRRGKDPLPEFDGDFYMMVQDWFEQPSGEMYHRLQYELISYRGIDDEDCFLATKTADGIDLGIVPFESALINGRGRRYYNETKPDTMVPLETFIVKRGGKYRFRLISAAMAYPFRVSIDHHVLHVISTDGNDVATTPVESIMLQSGERYDFWIEARDPTLKGNYWIRVETLEYYHHDLVKTMKTFTAPSRSEHRLHNFTAQENQKINPGYTLGILRYDDAPLEEPTTHRKLCTGVHPCTHLNCPFGNFMEEENRCVPITELRDTNMKPTLKPTAPEKFTEYFLNFHFSGRLSKKIGAFKPNINGKIHIPHDKPPQVYPSTYKGWDCDETECNEDACYCTHQLNLPLGHVVQMVLFTNLPPLEFIGITGTAHPVHMHGHSFQVIKVGYPVYNKTTGLFESNNPDILCNGYGTMCNQARWADPSWEGGNVPGIVTHGAPLKDSVIIPAGGYVVIRFLTDNPGFWFMHCHVEYHNEMGMALVLKEGDVKDMNAAPPNMQDCGDFTWSAEEFEQKVNSPSPPGISTVARDVVPCGDYLTRLKFTTFILAGTTIMFAVASFSIYCKNTASSSTASVPPPDFRRIPRNAKREEITQLSESNDEAGTRSKRSRRKRRVRSGGSSSRDLSDDWEQREPLLAATST